MFFSALDMSHEVVQGLSYTIGFVPGPSQDEAMVCQYPHMSNAQGSIWFGLNPLAFTTPVLFAQFVLIFITSRFIYFFLEPLRQSVMTAQIIAGIILGPSFLAQNRDYATKLLPPGGKSILSTAADVGFMIHLFLLGVQTDTTMLKKAGKNSIVIGFWGFVMAYFLGGLAMFILRKKFTLDQELQLALPYIITLGSISAFPVITSLLADLSILNSELGRLACFTSMISDLLSFFVAFFVGTIGSAVSSKDYGQLWSIFWVCIYLIIIVCVLRPWITRIGRYIPEGNAMREEQLIPILAIVLGCAFSAEVLGQHAGVGSFILGLAIPDGPPLGENLIHKLEAMSSGLFLPAKFGITGLNANFTSTKNSNSAVVIELIILFGYVGKFLGTLVSALFCNLPFKEAIPLSLVMCCKGIVDIALICVWKDMGLLGDQEYALLIITMLIVTGVARPLVGHLYDPSRRYMVHVRSSLLQYHHRNVQPRVLACLHREESAPTIINLLEALNPTKIGRLSVFVLNLKELKGRATSILVPNFYKGKLASTLDHSEHIVNVFSHYEDHHSQGSVLLQHFTAIAPYASMHDDICNLALDKRVTIVILPFHKQWAVDGIVEAVYPSIRIINRRVLNKAPCTVGVLVDRTRISGGWTVLNGQSLFRVTLLFLGGIDDREAFAYSSKMADHPHILMSIIWIRTRGNRESGLLVDERIDIELMEEFQARSRGNERVIFREEIVEDVVGTTKVIHSVEDKVDLFIVGRHHEPTSPVTMGITEWSECPELGVIGDMLATSEFTFSVLVIQQQPIREDYLERSYYNTKVHRDRTDLEDHTREVIR